MSAQSSVTIVVTEETTATYQVPSQWLRDNDLPDSADALEQRLDEGDLDADDISALLQEHAEDTPEGSISLDEFAVDEREITVR